MHLSQKNGSRGAFFLISSFLKGLTYSALRSRRRRAAFAAVIDELDDLISDVDDE